MVAFMSIPAAPSAEAGHFGRMDKVYRRQRYIYDFTRKYYLVGRDSLIKNLALEPGARLVEIGCGTGRNLIAIARTYPHARLYGLDASAQRAARIGFQGKMCIHPAQIETVNRRFTPSDAEIARAEKIMAAFDKAEAEGSASIQVDGAFVDYPIVAKARRVLDLVRQIRGAK